ncbi:flavodoxin domain-containing protein [Methanobacterium sp.]|uniref:flavodoxin family protein n=1 Tax=Methanobacterium sp. TaxID=2164 RepID=UPI002600BA02|nr:flavodoxin domain-containing protein [Methanobacterium sp.]MBI5459438.1 NAD(P)H-dependent oxidoreductase [Methanobacterium sp.]
MEIGIIVYSQTEHTYSVAESLQVKLLAAGHSVNIERVTTAGKVKSNSNDITFQNKPDIQEYDALIFGSPVHAFSLAPAMKAYLEQLPSLQDKNIACYVTKGLPFHRTGGNQAISQMKKLCQSKGGTILGTGIIVWRGSREKDINELVQKFSALF